MNYKLSLKPSHASLDSRRVESLPLQHLLILCVSDEVALPWNSTKYHRTLLPLTPSFITRTFLPVQLSSFLDCGLRGNGSYAHLIHCQHPIPSSQLSTLNTHSILGESMNKDEDESWDLSPWGWMGLGAGEEMVDGAQSGPWMLVGSTMPIEQWALFNQVGGSHLFCLALSWSS